MKNEKQNKQRVSCVTFLCSVKENSELNAVDSKINSAVSARPKKDLRAQRERETECARESHLKGKSWFQGCKIVFQAHLFTKSFLLLSRSTMLSATVMSSSCCYKPHNIARSCNSFLDYIEPVTPKMDAKSTACLSDVNLLRACPARDTIY